MGIRDLLYETWLSLAANKGRSFLTILGIVIGISSVIAMTSLIGGMSKMMLGEFGANQARVIQIYTVNYTDWMDEADLEALDQAFPELQAVAGSVSASATISTGSKTLDAYIVGATSDLPLMSDMELEQGRFFTEDDQRRSARVLIVGHGILRDLYGDENAQVLGQTVRVGPSGERYTIVGILAGGGTTQAYSQTIVPARTVQQRLTGMAGFDSVYALANEDVDVVELSTRIQAYLVDFLDTTEDGVYVYSMQEILEQLELVMSAFSIMLTAIASISLFVGGIGIMNMMLTTVTERTREIGLRKSLGAHTGDITKQFLAESIALCVVGGLLGIGVGYLGALALSALVNVIQPDIGFMPAVDIVAITVAVGVCALIGIVFGFYPARRAAKMDPVESLRYQ